MILFLQPVPYLGKRLKIHSGRKRIWQKQERFSAFIMYVKGTVIWEKKVRSVISVRLAKRIKRNQVGSRRERTTEDRRWNESREKKDINNQTVWI